MTPNETFNVAALGAFFALTALLALIGLLATVYTAVSRALTAREDRKARRHTQPEPADDIDTAIAATLHSDCCDTWWATAGARHDPDTCTHETEA